VTERTEKQDTIRDEELLHRYLDGEEAAFETLVRRYRRELFNFLARFTGDPELAEDVFQEAIVQLHTSAASFDTSRRLRPWLYTIAANKARDAIRSRYRKQAAPLDAVIGANSEGGTTFAELMPGNIPPPEKTLMNLESRRAVQSIVGQMPDKLRTVLLLSYFEDFQYNEIAEMLEIPLGTVKSRLHSAVKYFAKKWKAVAEDHEK